MSLVVSRPARGPIGRALDRLYLAAGWLAGLFLLVIFGLMMALSLGREVSLNIPAGDDFAAWSMAAMSFLGLAHTFKSGDMIRVGLLLERLHGRTKQALEVTSLAVGALAIGFFTYYAGAMTYDSWRFDDMSQGVVAVPLWIPQLGVLAGLTILLIAVLDELAAVVAGHPPSYDRPPPSTPDEFVERVAQGGGV